MPNHQRQCQHKITQSNHLHSLPTNDNDTPPLYPPRRLMQLRGGGSERIHAPPPLLHLPLPPTRHSRGCTNLGSRLSSSAALEVAVATFLERMIRDKFPKVDLGGDKEKALRCHLFWRLKQHCRKLITKLIAQGFTHRFNLYG